MKTSWYSPILRCVLLFVVGIALQLVVGDFGVAWMRYPWSVIVAINYLYLLVLCYAMEDKWPWARGLRSQHSSVVALASMVVMTVVFGLTRQDGSADGVVGALGFTRMTSSWPFNLLLLNFITSLGLSAIDDWRWVRQRKIAAVISHTAVFVALAAAMFSSGDKLRVRVVAYLDTPTYMAMDNAGREYELPFVVTLREFNIDEYPPKLRLLKQSDNTLSEEYLSSADSVGEIGGWTLRVKEYLPMAGCMEQGGEYRPMQHVGATHAAYVEAHNDSDLVEGWVSCGSHIFAHSALALPGGESVVMMSPEAKRYTSRIAVALSDKDVRYADVEVNHPVRVGAWRIYQVGYDNQRGRWSTKSVLECVRDGWYGVVHIALWLILASAVVMFITAGGRSLRRKDREGQL